jgi:HK97 family phage major capsid protein
MDRIDELMQKRAELVSEARSLADNAESEDRALNSEETQKYERINSELDSVESRIRVLKDTRERQRSLAEAEVRESPVLNPRDTTGDPLANSEERAYMAALDTYLRKGEKGLTQDESRALTVGTASAGGYLVAQSFRNTLVEALEQASAIRNFATVIRTDGGGEILIPKVVSPPEAEWVAEGDPKPEDDPVFDQASLRAHKNALIVKVSWELLEDAGFDLEGYVARELGRAIGRLEGAAFATGSSNASTTPKGLINRAQVGATALSETAITSDELIDLVYSVSRPYRQNARFLMADALVASVRKMKANDEYIWTESMRDGEPARILGYPVEVEPNMDATPAADDKPIAFGDLSGYFVREVNGIRIQRLNELYAASNHVGFLGEHRVDGDLIDENAVKVLQMKAGS